MSCRTDRLRGERSLHDAYTGRGETTAKGLPLVGIKTEQREVLCAPLTKTRHTSHEVTAPRAAGPSGRDTLIIANR
jgi:hypothetical protein